MSIPVITVSPNVPILFLNRPMPNYAIVATNAPTSFGATGLPPGLTQTGGHIIGTPTLAGFYSVVLTATNADGTGTATQYFNVGNVFPVINATDQTITQGLPFNYRINILQGQPSSWVAGGYPSGITFDTATGVFSGIPTVAQDYAIGVTASYGPDRGTSTTFNLSVLLADGGISLSDATVAGNVGVAVNFQMVFGGAITAFQTPDGLPAGLSISNTGLITGTPTIVASAAYRIIGTSGSQSAVATASFTIAANGAQPPVANANFVVQVNLLSGGVTFVSGPASAYYGEDIFLEVDFVPPSVAVGVGNVILTLKERSEVRQYQDILNQELNTQDSAAFVGHVLFASPIMLHSLLLFDGVDPSDAVTYDLQFFFDWYSRPKKSAITDFTIKRPLDLDPSEAAAS